MLVYNAGHGVDGVLETFVDEVIEKQFNTNVIRLMRKSGAFDSASGPIATKTHALCHWVSCSNATPDELAVAIALVHGLC